VTGTAPIVGARDRVHHWHPGNADAAYMTTRRLAVTITR